MIGCIRCIFGNFYPRPPRGGRPGGFRSDHPSHGFLSTPSARRATWCTPIHGIVYRFLSTPSARRATKLNSELYKEHDISIHALREEGDQWGSNPLPRTKVFLSTPSARRATKLWQDTGLAGKISIHALREEGDTARPHLPLILLNFYPRPPRGGRPALQGLDRQQMTNFYPRPPRGGRQQKQRQNLYFQTNYTTFCTNLEEP